MNCNPVFFVVGILLTILSVTMLLPAIVDLSTNNPDWKIFVSSSIITSFTGVLLIIVTREEDFRIDMRQAFLLTNLSWIVIALFGSMPFYFSELSLSFTDSFFEAMSGITTTGSTVLNGLNNTDPGILLWRSILQWLGGVGIIIMALSILPLLQVGGMQLFKAESIDVEKVLPSASKIAAYIGAIYIGLTFICAICYSIAGMTIFDSFAHAMTTIATGGFSTHDQSIGYFKSASIESIAIIFMLIGSLPFVLYLHLIKGRTKPILNDSQVRVFLAVIILSVFTVTLHLMNTQNISLSQAFRLGSFNFVSIITGTGYASADYSQWGTFIISLAFFLMCVGGCAGSTTCGIKIFRFQVLYSVFLVQMKKLLSPHGIFEARYNNKPIPDGVPMAVMSFFFMFAISFSVIAIALQLIGLDFLTSMSGAATAISNVGPALGDIIGPSGTFKPLPDAAKWVLCVGMLLGRLELFTLLVMLHPNFWRY